MPRIIDCPGCGRGKPHHAKGLCAVCYKREWRDNNPLKWYQQRVRARRLKRYRKQLAREAKAADGR